MPRGELPKLNEYADGTTITTRWADNDVYGHVNNAVYYFYFDTAVNEYLMKAGVLDFENGAVIGLVVKTQCEYYAPVAFPDIINARIRVDHIGNSSVRYAVGLFRGDEETASASGDFTHVYVDRETRRPAPLPADFRAAIEKLQIES